MNTLEVILLAGAASVPVAMIVGNHLARQRRTTRPAKPADRDASAINKGFCPDCGEHNTLLCGPSGGMSQNLGCNACLMEFNAHFGFGTGSLSVDRTGKLTEARARAFGIDSAEYQAIAGGQADGTRS